MENTEANYLDVVANRIADSMGKSDGPISLYRIYAVLCLAKAPYVTNEDVHNAWVAWKLGHDPTHRSAIPYHDLYEEIQELDTKFANAINLQYIREFPENVD